MKDVQQIIVIILAGFIFSGCLSTKGIKKEEPSLPRVPIVEKPPVPEITVQIGSLDVANLSKRIEKKDIQELTAVLKREKVDILAIEGITRYPGVRTRVDIVEELGAETQMQKVFGETVNVSGRQTGNAVFSTYPIRSNITTPYQGLHSEDFAAALQVIIDCGIRDMIIVSTHLPEKASDEDQKQTVRTLNDLSQNYINRPVIITGNLPASNDIRSATPYDNVEQPKDQSAPHLWYTNDRMITLIDSKVRQTPLGPVILTRFGIFRQTRK